MFLLGIGLIIVSIFLFFVGMFIDDTFDLADGFATCIVWLILFSILLCIADLIRYIILLIN